MELSAELLFFLGLASSIFVWLLKVLFVSKGKDVPVWIYSIVLGVVALVFAVAFWPVVIPEFPSHDGSLIGILSAVLIFAGEVLPVLAAVVGFARIIYEVLLQKVLDGMALKLRKALGSDIG